MLNSQQQNKNLRKPKYVENIEHKGWYTSCVSIYLSFYSIWPTNIVSFDFVYHPKTIRQCVQLCSLSIFRLKSGKSLINVQTNIQKQSIKQSKEPKRGNGNNKIIVKSIYWYL